jgi:hypothetical protein
MDEKTVMVEAVGVVLGCVLGSSVLGWYEEGIAERARQAGGNG